MRAFAIIALCTLVARLAAQEGPQENDFEAAMQAFDAKVSELRMQIDSTPWELLDTQGVRQKLTDMVVLDQYVREFFMEEFPDELRRESIGERMVSIDSANTLELKSLLAARGWPVISEYGDEADSNAWIMVQHADLDRDFQREVLLLLESLVKEGESNPSNFAYLYDRVARADGRAQRYGTQFQCISARELGVEDLEDPENVDALRAGVGLGTLNEYLLQATEEMGAEFIEAQCANLDTRE